jgi:hypothetical protein
MARKVYEFTCCFQVFHVSIYNHFENTIISFLITQIINNRPVYFDL